MKKILFTLLILLSPTIVLADGFSDLDARCTWQIDGAHASNDDKLVLKHINQKITKTEGYVKVDDYLYMVANTFTDNYRFLGSYLLRYDCKEKKTQKLSTLLKGNNPGELGFLAFDENSYNMKISLIGNSNSNTVWIFDYTQGKIKKVNYKKITKQKNKLVAMRVDLGSYDGFSVDVELLYYTKIPTGNGYTYQYENYNHPERVKYTF